MNSRSDLVADLVAVALLVFLAAFVVGMALGKATKPAALDAAAQARPVAIPGVTVDAKARRVTVDADSPLDVEICLAGDCRLLQGWAVQR